MYLVRYGSLRERERGKNVRAYLADKWWKGEGEREKNKTAVIHVLYKKCLKERKRNKTRKKTRVTPPQKK